MDITPKKTESIRAKGLIVIPSQNLPQKDAIAAPEKNEYLLRGRSQPWQIRAMNFPAWIGESEAGRGLRDFLVHHAACALPRAPRDVKPADFFPAGSAPDVEFSAFVAPKDSYFYSELLEAALHSYGEAYTYTDLCTGSAIPVLSALARWRSKVGTTSLPAVTLYDIEPTAVETARKNIAMLGFNSRVTASTLSVDAYFKRFDGGAGRVISINPPYVPFPADEPPKEFVAVAAGIDGLKYTRPVLDGQYAKDARIVLEWSSLANPAEVMTMIRARFTVEACYALEIGFGKYTRAPVIHDHLVKRRAAGLSLFGKRGESESQLLIGCLLRPRELD
jgi:methylase of polypeptide subunit release factors